MLVFGPNVGPQRYLTSRPKYNQNLTLLQRRVPAGKRFEEVISIFISSSIEIFKETRCFCIQSRLRDNKYSFLLIVQNISKYLMQGKKYLELFYQIPASYLYRNPN